MYNYIYIYTIIYIYLKLYIYSITHGFSTCIHMYEHLMEFGNEMRDLLMTKFLK